MRASTEISRRSVLAGGLVAVAGCTHSSPPPTPRRPSPDAAALVEARAAEQALVDAYDVVLPTVSGDDLVRLTAERALHEQHLSALHGPASPSPSPSLTPLDSPIPTVEELRAQVVASEATLQGIAGNAVDGANAALLASIAASHTVMTDE